jgi:hypothetical protein
LGILDLEVGICLIPWLTMSGFDFNINMPVLECALCRILDFGPRAQIDTRICQSHQIDPIAFAAFPGLEGNIDVAMSQLWSYLPTSVRDALDDCLDHVMKLRIVESMPFAGIGEGWSCRTRRRQW